MTNFILPDYSEHLDHRFFLKKKTKEENKKDKQLLTSRNGFDHMEIRIVSIEMYQTTNISNNRTLNLSVTKIDKSSTLGSKGNLTVLPFD